MQFLYAYPDAVVILIMAFAVALIALAVMFTLNRFVPEGDKEGLDLVMRAMTSTSAILTFVLAFSIVQAKSDLNKAQESVNQEARAFGVIDRLLQRFDEPGTVVAREALARYALSVVKDEWPFMLGHARSPDTGARVRRLSRYIDELQPTPGRQQTIFTELVRGAESLEQRRDDRLFHSENTRLPPSFWLIIALLLGAIAIMGAFFRLKPVSVIMIAGQSATFGILAAFLFVLDEPFLSKSGVTVEPFKRALATLSAVSTLNPDDLRAVGVTPQRLLDARPLQ